MHIKARVAGATAPALLGGELLAADVYVTFRRA
jgi:hypothetical protein